MRQGHEQGCAARAMGARARAFVCSCDASVCAMATHSRRRYGAGRRTSINHMSVCRGQILEVVYVDCLPWFKGDWKVKNSNPQAAATTPVGCSW
jgi:hypothetical protein